MRLATWNVNSLKARMPRVEEWLAYARPDVLCLQETKLADAAFPQLAFSALGYEAVHHGDGRWNGVAILSRVGVEDVVAGFADGIEADTDTRLVTARCGGVSVTSVYVPNGRSLDSDHYRYKLAWLAKLRRHLDAVAAPDTPVAVCGDFNIAPEDRDVWDPAAFVGSTHVSAPERRALAELESWGLQDAFRGRYPDAEELYTYWDYRAGDFHQHRGMRIDLLLLSAPLAGRVRWALVDRNARKGKQPSDHAPVFVDLEP
ncbi:exodeoxyribonuclease III [Acidimicrobiaceae bacterium USS-CC1]|uniref:Exodeoxyribonuclease III n=1 Tax=Acidiferrimicrobium australe TaxID=2664430 RepID=A0ABW9QUR9_9ACTN|nr:exodeoxyribonuclease III [Acidiferrimicrobium australe]